MATLGAERKGRTALFGPQRTQWQSETISQVQNQLLSKPELGFLADALKDLTVLRDDFRGTAFKYSNASRQLQWLHDFAAGGENHQNGLNLCNTQLAPLTVVSQTIDLIQKHGFPGKDDNLPDFESCQGFCIGFLSAACLASSQNWGNYRSNVAVAIKLAAYIGMIVDADDEGNGSSNAASALSVKWKSPGDRAYLEMCLDMFSEAYISCITDDRSLTVTLPSSQIRDFQSRLSQGGITSLAFGLKGRYHNSRHQQTSEVLMHLCSVRKDLQLPDASQLRLPLRSTSDGSAITAGKLHDWAVQLILSKRAHWCHTVKQAIANTPTELVAIGEDSCIPRSLMSNKSKQRVTPAQVTDAQKEEQIAVVGMACRFPEADNLQEFWKLIQGGCSAIGTMPSQRFKKEMIDREPRPDCFWGNFLRRPDVFDHRFFDISGREAKSMDPQQRLVLQVAYEALESSGYYGAPASQSTTDVGCYLGVGAVDYEDNIASEAANAFSATGSLRAFISGRISHYFGWSGPSLTVDTACSSSAVAIHTACKALLGGECSMALAGGVNVITSPNLHQNLAGASFLNPSGASKAFDADAGGYCRGEGSGILVLKPLSKALACGDEVLGVISGSAVNQGGNSSSITVPDSEAQSSLYKRVLSSAGINPTDVTYVEAHGTGTQVGDPIEYESVRRALTGSSRKDTLFVGSVKDNIGHAEAASGVAGVIKTLLMMHHKTIPQQANFTMLNPKIKAFPADNITIPTKSESWGNEFKAALVNNYGAAGSNAAILLRNHKASQPRSTPRNASTARHPVVFSAKTAKSLEMYKHALQTFLQGATEDLGDIAWSISRRQNATFEHRATVVISPSDGVADITSCITTKVKPTPVILAFGGQTGKRCVVSRSLYDQSSIFRGHLNTCSMVCETLGLPAIVPRLFDEGDVEDIVLLHCMLLALQVSTAQSWIDSGAEVESLVGHSFGQISALCVAGSISLHDAFRFVSGRARLIQDHWGQDAGAMLSVECSQTDLQDALAQVHSGTHSKVDIACYNGPSSFVLAGETSSIEAFEKVLSGSFKTKLLQNSHAYHSRMADAIMDPLMKLAKSLRIQAPRIRIETCSSGQSWAQFTPEALCQHTRNPVYFGEAVQRVASRCPSAIWLEAGSSSPIVPMVRRILRNEGRSDVFVGMSLEGEEAMANLALAACQLWTGGSAARYWLFNSSESSRFENVFVPPYQFEQTSHWIDLKPRNTVAPMPSDPMVGETPLVSLVTDNSSSSLSKIFVVNTLHPAFQLASRGHAVTAKPLCPASMYIELVSRCLMDGEADGDRVPYVEGLTMSAPLGLSSTNQVYLHLDKQHDASWKFSLVSQPNAGPHGSGERVEHGSGSIALLRHDDEMANMRLKILQKFAKPSRADHILNNANSTGVSGKLVYKIFSDVVEYAGFYHGVKALSALENDAIGTVVPPSEPLYELEHSICDPIALDNFLQVAGIHVNCLSPRKTGEVFMCTSINETVLSPSFMVDRSGSREWVVYTQYDSVSDSVKSNDVLVCDKKSGILVAAILGATFKAVPFKSLARTLSRIGTQTKPSLPNITTATEFESQDSGYHTRAVSPSSSDSRKELLSSSVPAPLSNQASHINGSLESVSILQVLREVLSEIIEIPVEDVEPSSTLDDLGVDSLLVTEVITEIKKHCSINLTQAELLACASVSDLADRIQSNGPQADAQPAIQGVLGKVLAAPALSTPQSTNTNVDIQAFGELALTSNNVFAETSYLYDQYEKETAFAGFCDDIYPHQRELVVQYVVEAFKSLGCDLNGLTPGEHLVPLQHEPRHNKVVHQLHRILEDANLIQPAEQGGYLRTTTPVSLTPSANLYNEMLAKFPKHTSETKLLWTTAHKLAECLTGTADPIALLFGDSSARALIGDVYANAPMFKTGTLVLGDYLLSVLKGLDHSREIKILEIGAGTGGTTQHIVDTIAALGPQHKFAYTFTDLSPSLVMAAKKRFSRYSFMNYSIMDIEKDPEAKHLGSYDIVISTNCIHATRDLTHTTSNIRKLLRPDGILCLLELTRNLFWFDLVFGLLEGWWLSSDGRTHALASEWQWNKSLRSAGFSWVKWTDTPSSESDIMRMIVASPFDVPVKNDRASGPDMQANNRRQTLTYKSVDGIDLLADIYFPPALQESGNRLPVALMIHGGGHVMLSRRDIRPEQTSMLLDRGFLPISVDYRLCPEVTLAEGPVADVSDALVWLQTTLPGILLSRPDIRVDGQRIVAVGWSTGGHLAMTLAWSSIPRQIRPPNAILAFYCPCDYEDPFWSQPNVPKGSGSSSYELDEMVWSGISDKALTAYNVAPSKRAAGGWLAVDDPRSRLALHMNHKGQTLPVLINGLDKQMKRKPSVPSSEQIRAVSPLAQISKNSYKTPTFIIHPRQDDLIPWEQAQRTYNALRSSGVEAELKILEGVPHLFDVVEGYEKDNAAYNAVMQGYDFLARHVAQ